RRRLRRAFTVRSSCWPRPRAERTGSRPARVVASQQPEGRPARDGPRRGLGWAGVGQPQCRRPLRLLPETQARRPTADRDGAGRRVQAHYVTRLSIRGRVVIAAALSILLAVVSLGIAVDFVVESHLRRSLDSSLRRRAVAVAQLSASAPALLTA